MMLPLPERGMSRSVRKHNCDWSILFDWVQGSVLFSQEPVSKMELVDALCDAAVYISPEESDPPPEIEDASNTKQELVYEAADIVWAQISIRHQCLGNASPYRLTANTIEPIRDWREVPGYSYCLLLALSDAYRDWSLNDPDIVPKEEAGGYVDQGDLFELLSAESLRIHGWEVSHVGWAPGRAVTFADVVGKVADFMHESARVNDKLVDLYKEKHELGLDLICCRRFSDSRPSLPYFLIQCASGSDWTTKTHTPDLELWREVIPFAAAPRRGFTIPFAFGDDEDFYKGAKRTHGVLLDRYRLLAVGKPEHEWIPQTLRERLLGWVEPRITSLRQYSPS